MVGCARLTFNACNTSHRGLRFDFIGSGLPAVLMQMRYSREHETEADMYALSALQKVCLSPKAFADILQRLQAQAERDDNKTTQKTRPKQDVDPISEIIASHPDTKARIEPFLQAKQNCNQANVLR
jgi:Zn-dependent protease with chaperone function